MKSIITSHNAATSHWMARRLLDTNSAVLQYLLQKCAFYFLFFNGPFAGLRTPLCGVFSNLQTRLGTCQFHHSLSMSLGRVVGKSLGPQGFQFHDHG